MSTLAQVLPAVSGFGIGIAAVEPSALERAWPIEG